MVLGELKATEATQALIAIQAQYGQSTDELSQTIDTLNQVENQTGISMAGLVQGLARAAGVARSAGVDVQHLAAYMAALVPASGGAAAAGNALKTIFSRLLSPTQEATQVMKLMGINTAEMGWKSLTAVQRLDLMAKKFKDLDSAQQAVVSATIASRYQINKFDVLMRDIINTNGYYQKSLNATSDATANFDQKNRELRAVLDSNPQKFKQAGVMIKNSFAEVMVQLLPYIIYVAQAISRLAKGFENFNPVVQKLVLAFAGLIFIVGPLLRYIGSSVVLFGYLFKGIVGFPKLLASVAVHLAMVSLQCCKIAASPFTLIYKSFALMGTGIMAAATASSGAAMLVASNVKRILLAVLPLNAIKGLVVRAFAPLAVYIAGVWATITTTVGVALLEFQAMVAARMAPVVARFALAWTLIYAQAILAGKGVVKAVAVMVGQLAVTAGAGALAFIRPWLAVFGTWVAATVAATSRFIAQLVLTWGLAAVGTNSVIVAMGRFISISIATMASHVATWATGMARWVAVTAAGGAAFLAKQLGYFAAWIGITYLTVSRNIAIWIKGLAETLAIQALYMLDSLKKWAAWGAQVVLFNTRVAIALVLTWVKSLLTLEGVMAAFMGAASAIFSPWGLIIGGVVLTVFFFRDRIKSAFESVKGNLDSIGSAFGNFFAPVIGLFHSGVNGIISAFNRLPQSVINVFTNVVKIVRAAAMAVYELFSYLNPFAHHSPSLVENVTARRRPD